MGNKKSKRRRTTTSDLNVELSEDDLCYLLCNTNYNREQIKQWYRSFIDTCPHGYLTQKTFTLMFKEAHPNGNVDNLCAQLFGLFDADSNGRVEFWEFMIVISLASEREMSKQLQLVFKLYDLNKDGKIDRKELEIIIGYVYDFFGYNKDNPRERAKQILIRLDSDKNGYLDEKEFIDGCLHDPIMRGLFSGFFEKFFVA